VTATHEVPTLSALTRVLPGELIERVLETCGVAAIRRRKLPPELVVWLLVAMGMHHGQGVRKVLRQLAESLGAPFGWSELPHSTSVSQARTRLGWEVMRELFRALAAKLRDDVCAASRWRSHPLVAIDGTCLKAADSDANDAWFGRPGTNRGGRSGYPQLRAAMLVDARTHVVLDAAFGPYKAAEIVLAQHLLSRVSEGTVLLLDRAYHSFAFLYEVLAKKSHFVVRQKRGARTSRLKTLRRLGRGDGLVRIPISRALKRRRPDLPDTIVARLITFRRRGFRPIHVLTSLLDPEAYPAQEIGALYLDRWEAELAYRELKTQLGRDRVLLRAHKPEHVLQEAYGLLIAYDCVRALMAEAAAEAGVSAHRLSFTDCLERIRLAVHRFAYTPPPDVPALTVRLLADLAACQLPPRRVGRYCDRAVKIKMSNYPRKRRGQGTATSRQNGRGRLRCAKAAG
jgi:hypothetical protein